MFLLAKIAGFVLAPTTFIVALFAAGTVLLIVRRNRWGRRLIGAGCLIILATSLLPVDDWLLRPLEDRFARPATAPVHVDGIILLGGAIDLPASEARGQFTLKTGAEAIIEFVALAERYPDARLVFSGGGEGLTEADVAHRIFSELGIAEGRVTYERRARNTRENAVFSAAMVRPRPGETWLLVAPASDMPRDVGCFRAVGWPVIAWPAGYRTMPGDQPIGVPGPWAYADIDLAVHEWLGLLYYRMRGWTDAVFPAPARS